MTTELLQALLVMNAANVGTGMNMNMNNNMPAMNSISNTPIAGEVRYPDPCHDPKANHIPDKVLSRYYKSQVQILAAVTRFHDLTLILADSPTMYQWRKYQLWQELGIILGPSCSLIPSSSSSSAREGSCQADHSNVEGELASEANIQAIVDATSIPQPPVVNKIGTGRDTMAPASHTRTQHSYNTLFALILNCMYRSLLIACSENPIIYLCKYEEIERITRMFNRLSVTPILHIKREEESGLHNLVETLRGSNMGADNQRLYSNRARQTLEMVLPAVVDITVKSSDAAQIWSFISSP